MCMSGGEMYLCNAEFGIWEKNLTLKAELCKKRIKNVSSFKKKKCLQRLQKAKSLQSSGVLCLDDRKKVVHLWYLRILITVLQIIP